jgi:SOS response regulatory protein OraA/RecX
MASDVLTLFNMPSSKEVARNYLDSQMVSPQQMGSQGLLQQVASLGGNAGTMLGYAGGRLFGGQAPQEARARGIEEAMAKVQGMGLKDDAEMYSALAQELGARGLSQDAMQAAQAARKVQAAQSQMTLEAARTAKESALAEKALRGEDKLPSYGAEREAISAELFNKTFKDLTPTERAAVNKRADSVAERNAKAGAIVLPGQQIAPKDWRDFREFTDKNPIMQKTSALLSEMPMALDVIKMSTTNDIAAAALPKSLASISGEGKVTSNADLERFAKTGGFLDVTTGQVVKFFSGKATTLKKAEAEKFATAVYRGALIERKKFIQDEAKQLGYTESPNYTAAIGQIDAELNKFQLKNQPTKANAEISTPAKGLTGDPLIDKYLK